MYMRVQSRQHNEDALNLLFRFVFSIFSKRSYSLVVTSTTARACELLGSLVTCT